MTRNTNGTWTLTDEEMNLLAIYSHRASYYFKTTNKVELSEQAQATADRIYDLLEKVGYYK